MSHSPSLLATIGEVMRRRSRVEENQGFWPEAERQVRSVRGRKPAVRSASSD
jgi:hypothetical protein